jgi:hypothetical protein
MAVNGLTLARLKSPPGTPSEGRRSCNGRRILAVPFAKLELFACTVPVELGRSGDEARLPARLPPALFLPLRKPSRLVGLDGPLESGGVSCGDPPRELGLDP